MNNKMFKVLELYFDKNMKPVDIAKELNVSKSAITQILQKDSRYENEKNRLILTVFAKDIEKLEDATVEQLDEEGKEKNRKIK